MDRLIRDMREVAGMILALHPNEEIGNPAVQLAVLAKKAAYELEKRRWIPVEERLPEEDCITLVCTKNGSIITSRFSADRKMWNAPGRSATHWMCLPAPPKEDEI